MSNSGPPIKRGINNRRKKCDTICHSFIKEQTEFLHVILSGKLHSIVQSKLHVHMYLGTVSTNTKLITETG